MNEDMVRAGYAWVYRQYCKCPACSKWLGYEDAARRKRGGLWAYHDTMPPWEFRYDGGKASVAAATSAKASGGVVHGNVKSHVFRISSCQVFNCKNCTAVFRSRDDAVAAGYRAFVRCGGMIMLDFCRISQNIYNLIYIYPN